MYSSNLNLTSLEHLSILQNFREREREGNSRRLREKQQQQGALRGGRRSSGAKEDGVAATTWSLEMEKEQNSSVVGESRRAAAVGIQRGGELGEGLNR